MDPSVTAEPQKGNPDHLSVLEEENSLVNKQEPPVENGEETGDMTDKMDLSNKPEVTEGAADRADISVVQEKDAETLSANGDEGGSVNVGSVASRQPLGVNQTENHATLEQSDNDGTLSDEEAAHDASQAINPDDESQDESGNYITIEGDTEGAADNHDQQVNVDPVSLGNGATEGDTEENEDTPASSSGVGVTEANIKDDGKLINPALSEKGVIKSGVEEKIEESQPRSEEDVATKAEIKEEEQEWQDILGNGLLKRRVLKQGRGRDTRPEKGQIVTLRTAGRMEDGTAVDWNHGMEFIQGDMEVIPALDLVVALMELQEVCQIVTDSKYAYGQYGKQENNPPIPPNANLTYEVELLAVRDGPNIHSMKDEERIDLGNKKRELGNDLYTRKDYSGAINCYQQALKFLGNSETSEVQEVKIKCWNNLAAAQLKMKAYQASQNSCMEVLQIDKDNVKALFRRGKVLAAQGELVEALKHTKKASQLEPGNKTIRSELLQMRRLRAAQHQEEKNLYQRMVGGLGKEHKSKSNGSSLLSWPFLLGATAVAVGGILTALYMTRH